MWIANATATIQMVNTTASVGAIDESCLEMQIEPEGGNEGVLNISEIFLPIISAFLELAARDEASFPGLFVKVSKVSTEECRSAVVAVSLALARLTSKSKESLSPCRGFLLIRYTLGFGVRLPVLCKSMSSQLEWEVS